MPKQNEMDIREPEPTSNFFKSESTPAEVRFQVQNNKQLFISLEDAIYQLSSLPVNNSEYTLSNMYDRFLSMYGYHTK